MEVRCESSCQCLLLKETTDFEKTFIQCIVYNFDILKEVGDEAAIRSAGKVMTKGKDYVVEDGEPDYYQNQVASSSD